VTAAVLPALGLRATDLHRDVVRVPQREENRARYFLDRHRLPDARFSAGGDRKDIRLCLDSEVDMVEPGATLVEWGLSCDDGLRCAPGRTRTCNLLFRR